MRFSDILQIYVIAASSAYALAVETTGGKPVTALVQRAPFSGSTDVVEYQPLDRRALFGGLGRSARTRRPLAAQGGGTTATSVRTRFPNSKSAAAQPADAEDKFFDAKASFKTQKTPASKQEANRRLAESQRLNPQVADTPPRTGGTTQAVKPRPASPGARAAAARRIAELQRGSPQTGANAVRLPPR